jgi:hypothetical protein
MIVFASFLLFRSVNAMAFFPFIILRHNKQKEDTILLNHEKIHLKQQAELLVVLFFLWYLAEYLIRFFVYKNFDKAYRNISFEREAYFNQNDMTYLSKRKFWSFLTYL